MGWTKNNLGGQGEDWAVDFLQNQGYRIIERNFKIKLGEIDIIARDGDRICFVEVKARTNEERGSPLEALTYFKRRKLSRLALAYLKKRYQSVDVRCRFDVIAIVMNEKNEPAIELIKDAFGYQE